MATKLLKETSRAITIQATVKKGNFEYEVKYDVNDGSLVKLNGVIHEEKTTEMGTAREYVGDVSLSTGGSRPMKSVSVYADVDTSVHAKMLDDVIAELREGLKVERGDEESDAEAETTVGIE